MLAPLCIDFTDNDINIIGIKLWINVAMPRRARLPATFPVMPDSLLPLGRTRP